MKAEPQWYLLSQKVGIKLDKRVSSSGYAYFYLLVVVPLDVQCCVQVFELIHLLNLVIDDIEVFAVVGLSAHYHQFGFV